MSLKDTCNEMKGLLEIIQADLAKADAGNKAAAQRVRTCSIRFEKVAKIYRKESIKADKSGAMSKAKKAAAKKKAAPKKEKEPAKKATAPKAAPKKKAAAKRQVAAKKAPAAKRAPAKKRATAKLPKKTSRNR